MSDNPPPQFQRTVVHVSGNDPKEDQYLLVCIWMSTVITPRSHTGTILAPTEAPQRAEFYPISPSHYTPLSSTFDRHPICHWPGFSIYPISLSHYTSLPLLLQITHPPAIGPVPSLSPLIPYWSAQSNGLLYNQLIFRARLTHRPDDGGSAYLWNVGRHSLKNTAVHPRRFWAPYSPLWELEIDPKEAYIKQYQRTIILTGVTEETMDWPS
jgi:hypothetical protein